MFIYKAVFIVLGTISLGLAVLGVFIPGLPTTPFVLLAAALYMRSSEKLYNSLMRSKFFKQYIDEYQKKKGMSLKLKIISIAIMWIMIFFSCFLIDDKTFTIIMIVVGFVGTIVMGFIVPNAKNSKK